jgi:hypothetical protein
MIKKSLIIPVLLFFALPLFGCSKPVPANPVPTPTPVTTTQGQPVATDQIKLDAPGSDQIVQSPLTVTGSARGNWYFEASFPVQLQDADGNVIASTPAKAQGDWMTTDFVPFTATLEFTAPATDTGFLVLKKDNPSGLPANDQELKVPVKFGPAMADTTKVKVFFNSEKLDPAVSCTKVFPVERTVAKSTTIAKTALDELLKGPTDDEKLQKYSTAINTGVTVKSVTVVDGVAKADFDSQLGYQVGGSCKVGLIRLQIEQTLKQFPTVKDVQISINGVSGDTILQP